MQQTHKQKRIINLAEKVKFNVLLTNNLFFQLTLIQRQNQARDYVVIYVSEAEQILNDLENQQEIDLEILKLNEQIKEIKVILTKVEKMFSNQLKFIQQQSQLVFIYSKLSPEIVEASDIQEAAAFLSNQVVDRKVKFMEYLNLSEQQKQSLAQSADHITSLLDSLNLILKSNIQQNLVKSQEQRSEDLRNYLKKYPIQLQGHSKPITAVALSNDEKMMASGGGDNKIILWDAQNYNIIQQFKEDQEINDLRFSNDDQLLAAAIEHIIKIFNISNLQTPTVINSLIGHTDMICRIIFTQDNMMLLSGSGDETLRIWNLNQQNSKPFIKTLYHWVYDVCISQNQKFISACCGHGITYLFDYSQQKSYNELVKWKAHECTYGTIFTSDSKFLLTCNDTIKVWNIDQLLSGSTEKIPIKIFKGVSGMRSIAIRMNNSILVSIDGDQIKIWNMDKNEPIEIVDVPDGYQSYLDQNFAITQDMSKLITGGENGKLKVFELDKK